MVVDIVDGEILEYCTPAEMAIIWDVSRWTVYKHIKNHDIEILRVGRLIYIPKSTPFPGVRKWKKKK